MQLLYHFMHRTWEYTELGVFGGVLKPVPHGHWIHMLNIDLCVNAYIYTWFPNKRYHVTQCCMTLLVESLSICAGWREQEQIKEIIPFKCSLMTQWVLGGLITGAWMRGCLEEHGWFMLCQKTLPQHGRLLTKTCITRVSWTTCTFFTMKELLLPHK